MSNSEKIKRANDLVKELNTMFTNVAVVAIIHDVGLDKESIRLEWHSNLYLNPEYYEDTTVSCKLEEFNPINIGPEPKK